MLGGIIKTVLFHCLVDCASGRLAGLLSISLAWNLLGRCQGLLLRLQALWLLLIVLPGDT